MEVSKMKKGNWIRLTPNRIHEKKKKVIAKKNIEILESGKLKINKNEKLSLKPFIQDSLDQMVCSRVEGIPNKENIVIDEKPTGKTTICVNLTSIKKMLKINMIFQKDVYTIVSVVPKKEYDEYFNLMDGTIIGTLLRTSTLMCMYHEIKENWKELNQQDTSGFTNVLFIPNILVFLDEKKGTILKKPYKINLLFLTTPSKKNLTEGIEDSSQEEVVKRMIDDVYDVSIRTGCDRLIIAPFCNSSLLEEPHYTSEVWNNGYTTDRVNNNIQSIDFCVNSDDLFVIFKNAK